MPPKLPTGKPSDPVAGISPEALRPTPPPLRLPPLKPLQKTAQPTPPPTVVVDPAEMAFLPPPLPLMAPPPLPQTPLPRLPANLEAWSQTSLPGIAPAAITPATPSPIQPTPAFAETPADPEMIRQYRLVRRIGEGGMGVVYEAEDTLLKRLVALKVMRPEIDTDETTWMRFLKEAQATAAIKSDRIATVYEVGEKGNLIYLAMELLRGESMESRIKRSPMPLRQSLWAVREAALGLAVAHEAGFYHRDIKPANLWLETGTKSKPIVDPLQQVKNKYSGGERANEYVRLKILDFGLVRVDRDGDGRQTNVVGTPGFIAPEQAQGHPGNERSDIFSLGVVLYRLTTGKMPFQGSSPMELLTAVVSETPPSPAVLNPKLPPALVDLILRMLSKDPVGRPGSVNDVAAAIDQILSMLDSPPSPPPRKKSSPFLLAAMLLAIVVFSVGWYIIHARGSKESTSELMPQEPIALPGGLGGDGGVDLADRIGEEVTYEFVVGHIQRTDDLCYLYDHEPPAHGTCFRIAIPRHITQMMRKRGSQWPDALQGASIKVNGKVTRTGRFGEILVSDIDQFRKIVYRDRGSVSQGMGPNPAGNLAGVPHRAQPNAQPPRGGQGPTMGPTAKPRVGEDLTEAVEDFAAGPFGPLFKGKEKNKGGATPPQN